jgi:hypothetical protein
LRLRARPLQFEGWNALEALPVQSCALERRNSRNHRLRREMERRHESHFVDRFDPPSRSYPCSRCDTREATDRWRKAARSSEAKCVRWLQVRRDGKGDQALGGRLHGVRAKNHHACRRDLEAAT